MKAIAFFDPIDHKPDFPKREDETLKFWKKEKIFEKSVVSKSPQKKWTFLDGPPFITGLPHYGTLLSSIPKDLFPRYWTMKGYQVRRVWGWDCHGLPAENKVEGKLGIKRKKDIEEKIGVKKFIDECKLYVNEVSSEWEWYVDHIGRWVDFKDSYKTMDLSYMETVMWVFKTIYDKGYIYKGMRISLYCPHCETPISNFEVAMDSENYKDLTEIANTYKYKLIGEKDTYLLAWSTTPWTKLTTTALAVNPNYKYIKVKEGNVNYILTESTLGKLKGEYTVVGEFLGKDLIGKSFEPHFNYFKISPGKRSFVILGGEFVTSDEGTGIVTIAPYGEEDLEVMEKENIHIELNVRDDGTFSDKVPKWAGMNYLEVNPLINKDLEERGLLYNEEKLTHSMPHCWRCHTQLLYKPQVAWYIDIQKLKPKLYENNKKVNWYPAHFKYGRFLKSMEMAPDWCISRSRYWGSPVPVWECGCGERYVPGSIQELEKLSGKKITDLHKPEIDKVTIKCPRCGKEAKRVPEVLDSWVEAGSASFAERHFPFEGNVKLEDFFPPDFIVEYTGQIRAWFYVLHVIVTALYDSNAFKNVVVTGVILGSDGRKMSKNYGNYPDPKEMLLKYGGDALRLYLMGSPVMRSEDILISEDQYREQIKGFLLILWNVYNFFVSYANVDQWEPKSTGLSASKNLSILDKWILLRLNQLLEVVTNSLEKYDTISPVNEIKKFVVEDLSLWYIRRSRDRVGPAGESEKDKEAFYQTCYLSLVTLSKLMAPFTPFMADVIYKNLTKEESVHLADWPKPVGKIEVKLFSQMQKVREIVEKVHAARKEAKIPIRQPLAGVDIYLSKLPDLGKDLLKLAEEELNIKKIVFKKGKEKVILDTEITPELAEEAKTRELIRKIQEERKNMGIDLTESIIVVNPWLPSDKKLVQRISRKTLATKLTLGDFKVISVLHPN
jgi:isoleucyl-tRNA synthetase